MKRNYEFWRKVLHKVFGFFCDVKTRICETLALRKDFRMIGTTLKVAVLTVVLLEVINGRYSWLLCAYQINITPYKKN